MGTSRGLWCKEKECIVNKENVIKHRIKNYEIETTGMDVTVFKVGRCQKEGKNKGEVTKTPVGYHSSVPGAVKAVAKLLANKTDTLEEWLKEYDLVLSNFSKIVKEYE